MWFERYYFFVSIASFAIQIVLWASRLLFGFKSFFALSFMPGLMVFQWLISLTAIMVFVVSGKLKLLPAPAVYLLLSALIFIWEQASAFVAAARFENSKGFGAETPYLEIIMLLVSLIVHMLVLMPATRKPGAGGPTGD
ncbi:MAG: hypothetical protein HY986_05125 [Candidatus Melainabacteria bacterium]|nr:hypothetical protein [Candidatus Melainabacteria bacterium]